MGAAEHGWRYRCLRRFAQYRFIRAGTSRRSADHGFASTPPRRQYMAVRIPEGLDRSDRALDSLSLGVKGSDRFPKIHNRVLNLSLARADSKQDMFIPFTRSPGPSC